MKQMQNAGVTTDFTITGPGRLENTVANQLVVPLKKWFHQLWNNRREMLIATVATCTISLSVLLISYLFFFQLAAHGW